MKGPFGRSVYFALLSGSAMAAITPSTQAVAQSRTVHQFDIPAQSASLALEAFGRQSGDTIIFDHQRMATRQSASVKGRLSSEGALRQLMAPTGIIPRKVNDRTFVIATNIATAAVQVIPASTQGQPQGEPVPRSASPVSAKAQDTGPAPVVEDIIVTGTRIVRDGYAAPTPVTVATVEDLVKSAPGNIPDGLNRLPQFSGSTAPSRGGHTNANEPNHGNVLNLRGLGGIRTLILLDGMRVPPTEFLGVVDVNLLPQALVQRVDVVTAGASATYGSDAISGVVNFVLDNRFNGVKGTIQKGVSQRGDNQSFRANIAYGADISDRAHILFAVERSESKGFLKSDRESLFDDYSLAVGSTRPCTATITTNCGTPGTAGNPYHFVRDVHWDVGTAGGIAVSGPFANEVFVENGAHRPVNRGTPTGSANFYTGPSDYYRIPGYTTASAPFRNDTAFGRFDFEVADEIDFYMQGSYADSRNSYFSPPAGLAAIRINSDNAFLPADLRARLISVNASSFNFSRRLAEFGPASATERAQVYSIMTGLRGTIANLNWRIDYAHGQSVKKVAQSNLPELTKLYAAIDAVDEGATRTGVANGRIVCRASIDPRAAVATRYAGCRPLNLFGINSASQEDWDNVTGTSRYRARNATDDVTVSLAGDLLDLPAGPVGFAVGGEYREQELQLTSNADPAIRQDLTGLERSGLSPTLTRFFLTNLGVANGRYNIKEGFAELTVPVLKDTPFARRLDLSGAVRYADYSTSGTATTWKLGAVWQPIDDIRLRITRSRDFRAPTLYDLFAGAQANLAVVSDPVTNTSATVDVIGGGNPDLKPEVGNTLSAGIVLQPTFLPGLSLSIDYYSIKITEAIGTLTPAQILQDCFDGGGSAPTCDLITRAGTNSPPTAIRAVAANIASIATRGLDIDATYQSTLGAGKINLRAYANYVDRFSTQRSATQPTIDYAGYAGAPVNPIGSGGGNLAVPKIRGTVSVNYEIGGFNLFLQEQMIGKVKYSPLPSGIYAEKAPGAVFYTDATISYRVPAQSGHIEFFASINNLFDRDAPYQPATGAPGASLSTNTNLYDVIGRQFTFGTRFKF